MEDAVIAENLDKPLENPVVEEVVAENSENPVENPPVKKNGRPKGSKDSVKRVVQSRKKITIIEEPLASSSSSTAPEPAPEAKAKAKAAPRPKVQINPEPVIQYVDRFVEHSPGSLMDLMSNHAMDAERAKRDARRDHFSSVITSRRRQLP